MPGDDLWNTVHCERVVLAVVRTVTTATRLLDVLQLLRTDPRVQIVFTFERSSAFTAGVTRFIESIGAEVRPWSEAIVASYSLAISASENGALHEVRAPLLLLPHGAGHHKYAKGTRIVSGYNPDQLVHDGRVVPHTIALSHPAQLDQLAASCPAALPRAVVTRDVCVDRLRASLPHRARYRRALGTTGRRLVVVSSTWGRTSTFGQDTTDVAQWAETVFARHPAASVAAAGDQLVHRDWPRPRRVTGDLALAASALCALVARHLDFAGDAFTVVLGDHKIQLRLTD